MKILLPIICFTYAFVFYMYSQFHFGKLDSLFPSPFFTMTIFLIIGIFFIFSFSNYSHKLFTLKQMDEKKDLAYYKDHVKDFFLGYSHYLSYIFFYIGVFFITKFLPGVYFSYCLFFTNIFVLLFFYTFRNLSFSLDFLRINQIIFSLIYIYSYVHILVTGNNFFSFIDFINSFLVIVSFLLCIHAAPTFRKDHFFIGNFYVYIYSFILFYCSFFFQNNYLFISVTNIILAGVIIGIANFVPKHMIAPKSVRFFGLITGYIGSIAAIAYVFQYGLHIIVYISLIFSLILNFLFHKKYQNYVSYFASIFIFSILIFAPSFGNIQGTYNFIFILFFSYFLITATYFFRSRFEHDNYFVHFLSYAYNLWGIIFFLVYYSPSLIQIAILMFVEFFYLFISYYQLSNKGKKQLN